jgi:hypothetical protein
MQPLLGFIGQDPTLGPGRLARHSRTSASDRFAFPQRIAPNLAFRSKIHHTIRLSTSRTGRLPALGESSAVRFVACRVEQPAGRSIAGNFIAKEITDMGSQRAGRPHRGATRALTMALRARVRRSRIAAWLVARLVGTCGRSWPDHPGSRRAFCADLSGCARRIQPGECALRRCDQGECGDCRFLSPYPPQGVSC